MNPALIKLYKLQSEINSQDSNHWLYEENLMFCTIGGLIRVNFFGEPWEDSFHRVLKVLQETDIAERIQSLSFNSPDEGANGTNNFDFSILTESDVIFPELRNFAVRLTEPEHHNRTIIARIYEEEGMIAKLLKKMPKLLSLQVPSAPNEEFFELNLHPLEYLVMQVGYETQNFILNLSNSDCFKNLWHLDFTDYQETYAEGWEDECTSFEHFERLFNSKAFDPVKAMILRNLTYSDEQIKKLKSIRKNTFLNLIRTESNYIY
jgi:hypothetical protein